GGCVAHRAAVVARVQRAAGEVVGPEGFASVANGCDLTVGGWVLVGDHPVGAGGDDLAVLHDDTAERPASLFHAPGLPRQPDCLQHEFPILFSGHQSLPLASLKGMESQWK